MIEKYLRHPPREPDYRAQRDHSDFVTNLNLPREDLARALCEVWGADQRLPAEQRRVLAEKMPQLIGEKYSQEAWNFSR